MPTATGTLDPQVGSVFAAIFDIEGRRYILTGEIDPNPEQFAVNQATLEYNDTSELTGVTSFSGQVGISTLEFNLRNGPKIYGDLANNARIDPALRVTGNCNWAIA